MRLHRLEAEGFGPFRSRQVVDFDSFADDGIFLIAGRTGAGKSSILDAVCFGLYGGVPRYEGGEKRLRSDYCEPDDISEVSIEFSTPAGRYRVTRSPEYLRPAKRGGGLTKQAPAVALEEHTESGWIGRAARAVDVAHELDEILQLSREQFLQVILLAQNRFSEFLLANSKDRQALLRRLFGTERFDDVQTRFDERRRASERALDLRLATIGARLDEAEALVSREALGADERAHTAESAASGVAAATDEPFASESAGASGGGPTPGAAASRDVPAADTGGRLDDLRRAEARAAYRSERRRAERDDAERALAAADVRLAEVREERAAQSERDRSRAALAILDAEQPQIDEDRVALASARSAEALRAVIDAAERAARAAESAAESARIAEDEWGAVDAGLGAPTVDLLNDWVAERLSERGAWEQAALLEEGSASRNAEIERARAAASEAAARVAELVREQGDLPAELARETHARDEARRTADRLDDLTRRRDQAITRAEAVRRREELREESAAAERALAEATDEVATAQTALALLRRRRLDGFAGELASTLTAQEPCPVCGSREHPAPAVHADPVSADDVEAAEAVRDLAARRERAASEHHVSLREKIAGAEAAAEGRTAETALAELEALETERRSSIEAQSALATHDAAIAAISARADALDDERAAAEAAVGAARETLAAQEQSAREAEARIIEARGEFPSVASRIAITSDGIAAATALASALRDLEQRELARAEAETARRSALADSPFETIDDARAALRSPRECDALEEKITRHAVSREKEKSILLPLEMRALPDEPIDIAPFEASAADARAGWITAVSAAGAAAGVLERLTSLTAAAADEHDRSAEEMAEHTVLQNLADSIAGRGPNTRKMTLETFVLAAELEEIVEAANRRLGDMSTGRYQLRHSDALAARGAASGLGIVVHDAFTGQTRPAQSLSGGETFLSSLALALGLAEVVTARAGGIRLDTLFIDEGFGSLDADTLDVAMRTLDELRQGGRTVGVISHVEAMQDQIPAQLRVRATSAGPSVIETR
ncbi:AAA family ATPase [Microbacterium galbinum]|uniref:AAA family ATPase n=1 Tax=Microbacterium galbinum TaxID=2851646 RepID=UPI001FFCA829|nr:AAA family ATPase [Microbacterium galbinum]MCK2029397.1 AAA family ATPase [Microbacterium galbinum]